MRRSRGGEEWSEWLQSQRKAATNSDEILAAAVGAEDAAVAVARVERMATNAGEADFDVAAALLGR